MHAALKDLKYVLTGISLVVAILVGYRRSEDPTSTPAGVRCFLLLLSLLLLSSSLLLFLFTAIRIADTEIYYSCFLTATLL